MAGLKRRGGVSVGVVLTVFAVLIYVLLPISNIVYERIYYNTVMNRALVLTELSVFTISAKLDTNELSEGRYRIPNIEAEFLHAFEEQTKIQGDRIQPENISVQQHSNRIDISFEFEYPAVFTNVSKKLEVKTVYRLPFQKVAPEKIGGNYQKMDFNCCSDCCKHCAQCLSV